MKPYTLNPTSTIGPLGIKFSPHTALEEDLHGHCAAAWLETVLTEVRSYLRVYHRAFRVWGTNYKGYIGKMENTTETTILIGYIMRFYRDNGREKGNSGQQCQGRLNIKLGGV